MVALIHIGTHTLII
uniref:Uncharacterized protein n=1 Tax=Anguilla anguilla TaxID=7936 RepID=A0A0E9UPJ4_ANGAN